MYYTYFAIPALAITGFFGFGSLKNPRLTAAFIFCDYADCLDSDLVNRKLCRSVFDGNRFANTRAFGFGSYHGIKASQ